MWLMVEVVMVCAGFFFLGSGIYYFIVLIAKIDQLLQHMCRYNR